MNRFEQAAADHLRWLRQELGAIGVKSEFEAQGMSLEELIRLKAVVAAAELGIILKVGGAEDVWGVKQALLVGVAGIIFPMVESPYAMDKSLGVVRGYLAVDGRKRIQVAVNIETGLAFENLAAILRQGKGAGLDAVTLGRVDLVGSLGLTRKDINSMKIFQIAKEVCAQVKTAGLLMTLGGGVEAESHDFIRSLVADQLLDRFETRMVVFPGEVALEEPRYRDAVRAAHQFERLWLEAMNSHYQQLVGTNENRLAMLRQRIEPGS